jgi:hypothetical protein
MFTLRATYSNNYFEYVLTSIREVKAAIATVCEDIHCGFCECFDIVTEGGHVLASAYAGQGLEITPYWFRVIVKTGTIKGFSPLKRFKLLCYSVDVAFKDLHWSQRLPQWKVWDNVKQMSKGWHGLVS